jgi:hypothetical protein
VLLEATSLFPVGQIKAEVTAFVQPPIRRPIGGNINAEPPKQSIHPAKCSNRGELKADKRCCANAPHDDAQANRSEPARPVSDHVNG